MRLPDAGLMRKRITYLAPTLGTPSAMGDRALTFAAAFDVFARVESLEGYELVKAKEVHPEVKVRVTCWFNAGIGTTGLFQFDGRTLQIASANSDEESRFLVCTCYERPGQSG